MDQLWIKGNLCSVSMKEKMELVKKREIMGSLTKMSPLHVKSEDRPSQLERKVHKRMNCAHHLDHFRPLNIKWQLSPGLKIVFNIFCADVIVNWLQKIMFSGICFFIFAGFE